MHPADTVFFWALSNPEHPALIQPDLILTYREVAEAVETVGQRLAGYGFDAEEPVAVSIHQPIQTLIVALALLRAGINVAIVTPAVLPYLRANGIYTVIFTGEGLVMSGGRNIRFEDSWLRRDAKAFRRNDAANKSLADRTSTIFLRPDEKGALKKIVVPGSALMARMRLLPVIGEANYTRALILSGLHTPSGFSRAAVNFYAGRTGCFASNNATRLLAFKTFNIDTLVCTPSEAGELISFIVAARDPIANSVREIWIEDGPVSPDLGGKIQFHICRNIIAGYGAEAAGRVAIANFHSLADKPGAVGYVAPHAVVEILDDRGDLLKLGETGRLRCRTEFHSKVFTASNPGSDENSAWCYPGPAAHLDADGMLYLIP